jgi:hypothetical protein
MTGADWLRIKQIAGDAWELPAGEREAYVRQVCAENDSQRIEVMQLLAAMAAASGSFDRIVIGSSQPLAADPRSAGRRAADRKPDRSSDR